MIFALIPLRVLSSHTTVLVYAVHYHDPKGLTTTLSMIKYLLLFPTSNIKHIIFRLSMVEIHMD